MQNNANSLSTFVWYRNSKHCTTQLGKSLQTLRVSLVVFLRQTVAELFYPLLTGPVLRTLISNQLHFAANRKHLCLSVCEPMDGLSNAPIPDSHAPLTPKHWWFDPHSTCGSNRSRVIKAAHFVMDERHQPTDDVAMHRNAAFLAICLKIVWFQRAGARVTVNRAKLYIETYCEVVSALSIFTNTDSDASLSIC